jgi:hypothetical protein
MREPRHSSKVSWQRVDMNIKEISPVAKPRMHRRGAARLSSGKSADFLAVMLASMLSATLSETALNRLQRCFREPRKKRCWPLGYVGDDET